MRSSAVEPPLIACGREITGRHLSLREREWLVTNGIGGFGMGTVGGANARGYHGLLVAALAPPVGRSLLLARLEETVRYDGQDYPLYSNHLPGGEVDPEGHLHIESFHLEGTAPVWRFAIGDALLEKRVWMQQGANTTYIQYVLVRATQPLHLALQPLVTDRDFHARALRDQQPAGVASVRHGLQVTGAEGAKPFYLLCRGAEVTLGQPGFHDYWLPLEAARGEPDCDRFCSLATFRATLQPGGELVFVASTEPEPELDGVAAYAARREHDRTLLERAHLLAGAPAAVRHLVLAADQFVVARPLPGEAEGRSIIAGYPWFSDWGRDTMISLPGLALVTGRPEIAATVLRTFAHYVSNGMAPNRFPDRGEAPEYNTIDATFWMFEAVRAYVDATGDDELLARLYPVLADVVAWHLAGARYGIQVDPDDGLLAGGEAGVQLTWMDARLDDWVVTPRMGKPVEVNALWYNALKVLTGFAARLGDGRAAAEYELLAERARRGFARFWNSAAGCCYDVIDGPDGHDAALRPNQILAVALAHSPLLPTQQRSVVDVCARRLLTSFGLRSLAPEHPDYAGVYAGDRRERDGAYHQGTVWGWLIGPFVSAHLNVYRDPVLARSFLLPLLQHLHDHGVGSMSEIFDGDPPHRPSGCPAQAWTVAAVLAAWRATEP